MNKYLSAAARTATATSLAVVGTLGVLSTDSASAQSPKDDISYATGEERIDITYFADAPCDDTNVDTVESMHFQENGVDHEILASCGPRNYPQNWGWAVSIEVEPTQETRDAVTACLNDLWKMTTNSDAGGHCDDMVPLVVAQGDDAAWFVGWAAETFRLHYYDDQTVHDDLDAVTEVMLDYAAAMTLEEIQETYVVDDGDGDCGC